jgi:hypothetical protein
MTLSEIETILAELAYRHEHLNEELLHVLLQASGWEEKTIKEAEMLFKQHGASFYTNEYSKSHDVDKRITPSPAQPLVHKEKDNSSVPLVVAKNEDSKKEEQITFYKDDGVEEGDLHVVLEPIVNEKKDEKENIQKAAVQAPSFDLSSLLPEITIVNDIPVVEKEVQKKENVTVPKEEPIQKEAKKAEVVKAVLPEKKEEVIQVQEKIITPPVLEIQKEIPPLPERPKEPESLIRHDDEEVREERVEAKQAPLPGNLPLLPFESSPHVWSFSKYKDVFHGEVMPQKEEPVTTKSSTPITKEYSVPREETVQKPLVARGNEEESEEVSLERTPMTKGDESLVFLAGVMLLAIILILGYMYSNGRL